MNMHLCRIDPPEIFADEIEVAPYTHLGPYGQAIDVCVEAEDGKLYATNGEYTTQVNFCPFCGYESKVRYVLNVATEVK